MQFQFAMLIKHIADTKYYRSDIRSHIHLLKEKKVTTYIYVF